MFAKQILTEILRFYLYKLDNNLCTMEEIESAIKAMEGEMELYGTIQDFAQFYEVSEGNVRATINRKMIDKPQRKVFYPFHRFRKIIPEKWRKSVADNNIHET